MCHTDIAGLGCGVAMPTTATAGLAGEDNEAVFQWAVIKFRQKEVTEQTEKGRQACLFTV